MDVVTFRTIIDLQESDIDVSGLIHHGLLLSEKASKGVFRSEAFLGYDEAIRKRAGRDGEGKFGDVKQEEVMRHFSYNPSKPGNPVLRKGAEHATGSTQKMAVA